MQLTLPKNNFKHDCHQKIYNRDEMYKGTYRLSMYNSYITFCLETEPFLLL